MLDPELVEDSGDHKVDDVGNAARVVIKTGHGGKNYGAGFRSLQHVRQVNTIQRRFPGNEDERAAFLQADIGRPVYKILRQTGGNRPKGAHRARDDDHACAGERAAGQRGRDVRFIVCMDPRWKVVNERHPCFQLVDVPSGLR